MNRLAPGAWVTLLIGCAAGCAAGPSTYGTIGGGHAATHSAAGGSTTGGGPASGSTGAGTTSGAVTGAASTTGAAATSTSGGSTSGAVPLNCPTATLGDCDADAGEVELLSQVYDAAKMTPINATVVINDLENPGMTGVTGQDGIVKVCVPAGSVVAPQVQVSGYVTTICNDVVLDTSHCFPGLQLFDTTIWSALQATLPGFDTSKGAVAVGVSSASTAFCDRAGWTVWAAQADGGALSFSVAYGAGVTFDTTLSATTGVGVALLYNIDLSGDVIQVLGAQDAGPGASGLPCGQAPLANEYNGLVHVAGNGVISSFSFIVTDAGD